MISTVMYTGQWQSHRFTLPLYTKLLARLFGEGLTASLEGQQIIVINVFICAGSWSVYVSWI